ncbi:transmembrane reductase CYB561D2-like [Homarus americanus]|uniref:transmembrane reductase CYB561D2-like n=1 Tax=Homarus americanus TaxID=6706 RepID=UPI001C438C4D|nr:transmembrane reductase CYB561D2-like [Homarus americanus]
MSTNSPSSTTAITMLLYLIRATGAIFPIYVGYLTKLGSSLFSYHPFFMTVAFTGLMTEAVFMFSEASLAAGRRHSTKITAHWFVLLLVAVAHSLGFASIYINKELNNKPHFTSWHGSVGLVTSVLLWAQLSVGVFAKYPRILSRVMQARTVKANHGLFGMVVFSAGMITIALGLWSTWFQNNASQVVIYSALVLHISLMFIVCKKFIKKYA